MNQTESLADKYDRVCAERDGLMIVSRASTEAMDRAKAKIDELRAENERLRAALDLHKFDGVQWCDECEKQWPCPTALARDKE